MGHSSQACWLKSKLRFRIALSLRKKMDIGTNLLVALSQPTCLCPKDLMEYLMVRSNSPINIC